MSNERLKRIQLLFKESKDFAIERQIWSDDTSLPGVSVDGRMFKAFDRIIAVFASGDIPGPCRKLADAVQHLENLWIPARESALIVDNPTWQPDRDVWKAVDAVCEILIVSEPKPPRVIESIEILDKQGVSDAQIAIIKGWENADGSPDLARVHLARSNPAQYDTTSQVPAIEEHVKQQLQASREAQAAVEAKVSTSEAIQKRHETAPETIADLILQGVTPKQIASLKGCTVDEVIATAMQAGLPLEQIQDRNQLSPPINETESRRLDAVANMHGRHQSTEDLASDEGYEFESGGVDSFLEERIIEAADMGLDPKQIAKIIGGELTYQKVSAILAKTHSPSAA